jgi:hypothetical protein
MDHQYLSWVTPEGTDRYAEVTNNEKFKEYAENSLLDFLVKRAWTYEKVESVPRLPP